MSQVPDVWFMQLLSVAYLALWKIEPWEQF